MMSESAEEQRHRRQTPNATNRAPRSIVPFVMIVALTPFVTALAGVLWAAIEIWHDPQFAGDTNTLGAALRTEKNYLLRNASSFFALGLFAGFIGAVWLWIWRRCCGGDSVEGRHS